ncbi:hypothetical protein [uncultured Microbacterium sp.]|uniref:hypothetical protein n=1 Tax=uncultured Microbacterium sp. TaxID=191216 RepID=UPI00261FAA62|nr:hypothetical protein [uncultured Microbacterium sp.]
MTDPQLPPPGPSAPLPPVPQAPAHPQAPAYPQASTAAPAYPAPGYPVAPPTSPAVQAPPGAYGVPVGGYALGDGAYQPPSAPAKKSPMPGIIALLLGVIAVVVSPIMASIAGYRIGFGMPGVIEEDYLDMTDDVLYLLSPVRNDVLLGEISFWIGTLAGIAAIIVGIIAIVKRAGRGWAITALVLGVIAPFIFFLMLAIMLGIGASAGAITYYS